MRSRKKCELAGEISESIASCGNGCPHYSKPEWKSCGKVKPPRNRKIHIRITRNLNGRVCGKVKPPRNRNSGRLFENDAARRRARLLTGRNSHRRRAGRLHELHRLHGLHARGERARQTDRLLEGRRSAELSSKLAQIRLQPSPRLCRFRAETAGVHVSADAIREGEHFLHFPGHFAGLTVTTPVIPLQSIGRPFELLHVIVERIIYAIQTSDRTSEVLAEIIRIILDAPDQLTEIGASQNLRSHRLLHCEFLDSLLDRAVLPFNLLHNDRLRDRLRDRLHDSLLPGTGTGHLRTLPERYQPEARKCGDRHTCYGIPDLSFHNPPQCFMVQVNYQGPWRFDVSGRVVCATAPARSLLFCYHQLTIALSSGRRFSNKGAKIRLRALPAIVVSKLQYEQFRMCQSALLQRSQPSPVSVANTLRYGKKKDSIVSVRISIRQFRFVGFDKCHAVGATLAQYDVGENRYLNCRRMCGGRLKRSARDTRRHELRGCIPDFDAWRADGGRVLSDTCALIIKERGRR